MTQITDEMKVAAVKAYTEVDGKCRPAAMQKALEAALPFLSSPGKDGGQQEDLSDLPDQFETWWQTSRFNQEPCDRYSQRKQLAWDAYYAASIAPKAGKDGGQEVEAVACAARRQGTAGGNDPADCDWPFCGCDPYADKLIAAIEESGRLDTQPASTALVERLTSALAKLEREASEVSKIGAKPGAQWTRLAGALINARSALSASTSREEETKS